jgi:ketosteroid isomerase-like protein
MHIIFAELATGNGQPFLDAMHDDFAWTISGQGPSARTWHGRDAVRPELFRQLSACSRLRDDFMRLERVDRGQTRGLWRR